PGRGRAAGLSRHPRGLRRLPAAAADSGRCVLDRAVSGRVPAWSTPFSPEALRVVRSDLPARISREWAWAGSDGHGVKVAVIDSGIDASHPAVGAVQGYATVLEEDQVRIDTRPHEDAYGHGTACAGIIRSLAPACELYSVKVLGAGLTGRGAVFAAGL